MSQNKSFDFQAYNKIMESAGAGLKLHLIEGMLDNICYAFHRYHNPLLSDAEAILAAVQQLRKDGKAAYAKRQDAKQTGDAV